MTPTLAAALASALHVLGIAGAFACAALRLSAMRRHDVDATRASDNANGLVALVLYGAGLWRLFAELEKPTPFYTDNPWFWAKVAWLGLAGLLELYPQYVVLPWHIRAARKLEIQPISGQFEKMAAVVRAQVVCYVAIVACAVLMARGVGLSARPDVRAPSDESAFAAPPRRGEPERGRAVYERHCMACHQPDGRGLGGRAAADLTARPGVLDASDDDLLRSIRDGRVGTIGAMPGWAAVLSDQEQRDALAWLRVRYGRTGTDR